MTTKERATKKPGRITPEEMRLALINNEDVKRDAKEIVAYAIARGWARYGKAPKLNPTADDSTTEEKPNEEV